jgi:hypothetical protein
VDEYSFVLGFVLLVIVGLVASWPVLDKAVERWELRQWGQPRGREPWYVKLYYGLKG